MSESTVQATSNLPVELKSKVSDFYRHQFINFRQDIIKWEVEMEVNDALNVLYTPEVLGYQFASYQGDPPFENGVVGNSLCVAAYFLKDDTIQRMLDPMIWTRVDIKTIVPFVHLAIIGDIVYFYVSAFDETSEYTPAEKKIALLAEDLNSTTEYAFGVFKELLQMNVNDLCTRLGLVRCSYIKNTSPSTELGNIFQYAAFDKPEKIKIRHRALNKRQ